MQKRKRGAERKRLRPDGSDHPVYDAGGTGKPVDAQCQQKKADRSRYRVSRSSKINQLVKRYDETRKMMKSFTGKGGAGRMNRMFRGM